MLIGPKQITAFRQVAHAALVSKRTTRWHGHPVCVETRRCNRPGCTKCPHGPYVYILIEGQRRYIGSLSSI
jgi:hypothetical protein